jgi:hypothetical protein
MRVCADFATPRRDRHPLRTRSTPRALDAHPCTRRYTKTDAGINPVRSSSPTRSIPGTASSGLVLANFVCDSVARLNGRLASLVGGVGAEPALDADANDKLQIPIELSSGPSVDILGFPAEENFKIHRDSLALLPSKASTKLVVLREPRGSLKLRQPHDRLRKSTCSLHNRKP